MSSSHVKVFGAGAVDPSEDPFSSLLLLAEQADDEAAARKQEQEQEEKLVQRKHPQQDAASGPRDLSAVKLAAAAQPSTSGAGLVGGAGPASTLAEVDAPAKPGDSTKSHLTFGSGVMAHMSFNGAGSDTQRSQQETSQEDPVTVKMALNHDHEDDAKSGSASGAAAGVGVVGGGPGQLPGGAFTPYGLLPPLSVQAFGAMPGMVASMMPGLLASSGAAGAQAPSGSGPGQAGNDTSNNGGAGSQSQQPLVVTGMPLADYAQQWQMAQQQQQMMAMYYYWQMAMASMYANSMAGLAGGVMPGAAAGFGMLPGMNPQAMQDMMAQMQNMQSMMMASMGAAAPGAAGMPPGFGMPAGAAGAMQMPPFAMPGMPMAPGASMPMPGMPPPVGLPAPPGAPSTLPGLPSTLPPGIQICDSLPMTLAAVQDVPESEDHDDSCERASICVQCRPRTAPCSMCAFRLG